MSPEPGSDTKIFENPRVWGPRPENPRLLIVENPRIWNPRQENPPKSSGVQSFRTPNTGCSSVAHK